MLYIEAANRRSFDFGGKTTRALGMTFGEKYA
jgi:hypothetical protein